MMTINPPTAALLLSEFVTLEPDEWVIQNAANSAVGLYLVQLARDRGQRTVSVVRREDAAAIVREAGGDVVLIDGDDLASRVAEATGGAEIRLGIDAVGGTATGRLADCLCRRRDPRQLRPHERRALHRAAKRLRLPRPDASRLLARALVPGHARERARARSSARSPGSSPTGTLHAPIHATYDVSEIQEAVAVGGERPTIGQGPDRPAALSPRCAASRSSRSSSPCSSRAAAAAARSTDRRPALLRRRRAARPAAGDALGARRRRRAGRLLRERRRPRRGLSRLALARRRGKLPAVVFLHGAGGDREEQLGTAVKLAERGAIALTITAPSGCQDPASRGDRRGARPLAGRHDRGRRDRRPTRARRARRRRPRRPRPARARRLEHGRHASRRSSRASTTASARPCSCPRARRRSRPTWRARRRSSRTSSARCSSRSTRSRGSTTRRARCWSRRAAEDSIVPRAALDAVIAAAPKGTKVEWYPTDHALNEQAETDRIAWLADELGLTAR